MDKSEEQANALHGLADAFEAVQDIDSNAPGFVIRLRGLQLRAAEIVMQALTSKRLENKPFTDRLWWLAKHHAEFAETIEPPDVRRVAFLRNLWLDICGFHIADGEQTESGVRVLRVKGEPLFATPFDCREIALQALQPDAGEFATEAARQARQRSAFICRTFAAAIQNTGPKTDPAAAIKPIPKQGISLRSAAEILANRGGEGIGTTEEILTKFRKFSHEFQSTGFALNMKTQPLYSIQTMAELIVKCGYADSEKDVSQNLKSKLEDCRDS